MSQVHSSANESSLTDERNEPAAPAQHPFNLQLDTGNEYLRFRQKWWQLWLPKDPPAPAPASLEDARMTPLVTTSILSEFTYTWITDIMVMFPGCFTPCQKLMVLCGVTDTRYQRTLQASDLYKMDPSREAGRLSEKLEAAWARRVAAAADWNDRLEKGEVDPSFLTRLSFVFRAILASRGMAERTYAERRGALEKHWRDVDGRKEASLTWALNDVFGGMFWIGGGLKASRHISQLMSPIVLKSLITLAEERAAARETGEPAPSAGRGVGIAFGLFLLAITTSVCSHQFFWRSMATGVLTRAALIASIYERGVSLTGRARVKLTNATLLNHISSDLGPSALAGFALFVLVILIQERVMSFQHQLRLRSMVWTDRRAKVLLEILSAMRVVKYFSYEISFLQKIFELREKELRGIRKILHSSSAKYVSPSFFVTSRELDAGHECTNNSLALAMSLPVLAATLSFVTYTLTAHSFNVAVIFSSLSLFNLLREPMMRMPRALSAIPDAASALQRLTHVFNAELLKGDTLVIVREQDAALVVKDATFEWETSEKVDVTTPEIGGGKGGRSGGENGGAASAKKKAMEGQLTAIVGPVGSGKSSLLQGLIGEMRKVSGHVSFGGRVAYCPQTAWIQNTTLRNNIIFGQPFDEDKYWRVIEVACLLPDLQLLPDGDLTEIGEKGINLSGGQKQRVNIARALYVDPEIVVFDDPFSAVDANVGKALFDEAIIGTLRNRGITVILVTHAIHFLSQVDYIYTMNNGGISESGTYVELIANDGVFAKLDREYGGRNNDEDKAGEEVEQDVAEKQGVTVEDAKLKSAKAREKATGRGKTEGHLIVKEQRTTGSVSLGVYWAYLVAARGAVTVPLALIFLVGMQGSSIMNSYVLVWWESNTWNRPNSFYQILYGFLGVSQAIFTFLVGASMDFMAHFVSQNLHHASVKKIFYAPMSFFDTTPMGRILSVFGKDIDSVDNQLALSVRLLVLSLAIVVGAVIIVSILEPYFLIAVVVILTSYSYFTAFYRTSAREVKRLDSMLRSLLYVHFAETLTGLPTIRSYGEMKRFVNLNRYYIDLEDRSLYLVITNQRWLAIRLDFMGGLMVFIVAMLAATDVSGINPAQIGLVLTYTTALSQLCTMVTRQIAEVENYMNSVERVVQYTRDTTVPQEAPHEIESSKPQSDWPSQGALEFNAVKMSYRPGLPLVLNGISLSVKGGEKIGVVGRTGAGKSSLMLVLYRIVELSGGSIVLDGIDISTIGLKDLRTKMSIIPQDVSPLNSNPLFVPCSKLNHVVIAKPLLFSGTIRSNLDPFNRYDDATLWDALRRSCLVDTPSDKEEAVSGEETPQNRYNLDSVVESEGANLSVGERSLLSLARALVKDCKVVVLDEATASVGLETDSKIQRTIQTEFSDHTLLCIAHRLRTIISYDRILVLDAGQVAEFDTPYNLYQRGGLFRGMCERSNISLTDIEVGK
ncbi:ABC protein [Melanogaster broomeanus]|nr:ABC protein [Melanogaster broomeanus]